MVRAKIVTAFMLTVLLGACAGPEAQSMRKAAIDPANPAHAACVREAEAGEREIDPTMSTAVGDEMERRARVRQATASCLRSGVGG